MGRDWKPNEQDWRRRFGGDPPGGSSSIWSTILWILLTVGAIAAVVVLLGRGSSATTVSRLVFREQLAAENIQQVRIAGDELRAVLKQPAMVNAAQGGSVMAGEIITYFLPSADGDLFDQLEEQAVTVVPQAEGFSLQSSMLWTLLPFLLLGGLAFLFFKRSNGGIGQGQMPALRSGAKPYDSKKVRTTFADVAGAEATKAELQEIIQFLKHPERFQRLGAEIPKGVLLVGPPGTGKTMLARAVAGEANVPFFSITGSNFVEVFVGVGAARVRDLFQEAKKAAPSIIFIDELDSIGRRRGSGLGGAHDEREQTLNQLLAEMDGFESFETVIVIASTNRPDILDPALMRPGRFDRHITVDLPTMRDRLEILKIHARNKPLADPDALEALARGTPGFSGAHLENVLNEAALLAARKGKFTISGDDIEEAKDKVLMGLARENVVLTDAEWRTVAYHEAGHAVVAALLPHADPVHKVTIVPRGRAMGVTQQLPEGEKFLYPREYMLDRLAVMMGGRAAEEIVNGTVTTGAENDLKEATRLVRRMILDWGMGERLGLIAPGTGGGGNNYLGDDYGWQRDYSESTAREVDEEIRDALHAAYQRVLAILRQHRAELDGVAEALLEHEIIAGELVLELVGNGAQPEPATV